MSKRKGLQITSLVLSIIDFIALLAFTVLIITELSRPTLDTTGLLPGMIEIILVWLVVGANAVAFLLTYLYCKKVINIDAKSFEIDEARKAQKKQQKIDKLQEKMDKLKK